MSTKIIVQTEIREMAILRDTLEEMGLSFTAENENIIRIQNMSYPVSINLQNGSIDYDSDQRSIVDDMIQKYAVNYVRDEYLKRGLSIQQEVDQQGRIHIIAH
jgi:intein-encoded DNA endonuclease-like protein